MLPPTWRFCKSTRPRIAFPVRFGDSTRLKVGQRIFAIGNPFGLERTMTTGVISSLNRTLPVKGSRNKSFIQIDAAINPGNSGGPLLDSHGRLIGMNTAIASKTGQNTGVGFAMPVSVIARVVPELITKGHVIRPDTGILKVYETERGLLIAVMQPGGPAEQAGLRGPKITKERKRQGPFVVRHANGRSQRRRFDRRGRRQTHDHGRRFPSRHRRLSSRR